MKKTLFSLLALAGVAFGDTTFFTDFDNITGAVNGITYSTSEQTGLPFTDGVNVASFVSSAGDFGGLYEGKFAITVAFTLNLTEALLVDEEVDLIGISGDAADVGLTLLGDGRAKGKWNAGTHGDARMTLSGLSSYAYTVGDESFVTLTLTASKPSANGGRGVQVYVNDGTCVFNHAGLGTNNNEKFDIITVNTDYIAAIAIAPSLPELVNDGSPSLKAAAVGLSLQAAVPEPATATLSLLALAGLAVRRRRK